MNAITTTNQTAITTTRGGFDVAILAGSVSESTQRMYSRDFRAYLVFAGSFDAAMEPATLAQWRSHLATATQDSPNTINRMVSAVKRLVKEAGIQGYISHETAAAFARIQGVKVKAMKENLKANSRTAITPAQMRAITSAPDTTTLAGKMHHALLMTLAGSGLRVSEVVTLTSAQIQMGESEAGLMGWTVSVAGKNKVDATPRALSPAAKTAIDAWVSARSAAGIDSPYIFTGFTGRGSRGLRSTPIATVSAWETVQRYAGVAGVENVKPHDFRRFVGTQLAKKDIRLAQKQLGHASIETTAKHYVLDGAPVGCTDNLF